MDLPHPFNIVAPASQRYVSTLREREERVFHSSWIFGVSGITSWLGRQCPRYPGPAISRHLASDEGLTSCDDPLW